MVWQGSVGKVTPSSFRFFVGERMRMRGEIGRCTERLGKLDIHGVTDTKYAE